jgi:hypothetical protein
MDHKKEIEDRVRERHRLTTLMQRPQYVPANLSRNHPDYGMSMEEHLEAKMLRKTQKSS